MHIHSQILFTENKSTNKYQQYLGFWKFHQNHHCYFALQILIFCWSYISKIRDTLILEQSQFPLFILEKCMEIHYHCETKDKDSKSKYLHPYSRKLTKKEKSPRKCKMICLPWKITLLHFLNPSTSLETKAITQLGSCMDRIWQNYRTKRKGKGYLNYTTKNAPLVTQFNLPEI